MECIIFIMRQSLLDSMMLTPEGEQETFIST